jgi:hypothetical protein
MDSPNYPKSDPSLLLLNEIEILLAQTRLMELYLKQAQVTAATDAARIQEQHQAELAALRYALAEKEQLLTARQNTVRETEKNLFQQVQNLQHQVSDQQRRFDECNTQLHHADSEVAALREGIAQLQTAKAEAEAAAQQATSTRQELQSALTALRRELEDNQREFQRQQLVSRALQENLHGQLEQLSSQLAEKQAWAAAGVELEQARIEITELRQRVAELQASRQEIEAAAARTLEQTRVRFETELAGLHKALSGRDQSLRETQSAIGAIEHSLRAEIDTLRIQLGQKQELIESRDGELRVAHEQIAALQQRIIELETAHQQAAANAAEAIGLRGSFENEISTLRHEVAVRERALSERQEAVTAVELPLHGKIQALQQELAHSRSAIEARASEIQNARAEAELLRQRMGQLESAAETNLAARQFAEEARQTLETELAKLTTALAQKEALLSEHEGRFQSLENQLRGEISDLRNQLEEQKQRIEQSHSELERLRSETALFQEHKAQSEQSRRELEQNLQQTTALRQELEGRLQDKDDELRAAQARTDEQREAALQEQEARFKSDEEQLGSDLALLRSQLDQQQTSGELARQELVRLQAEISSLREQNTQSETSHHEIEKNWQQAAALRQDLERRLQAKEEEFRAFQSRANEEKELALKEQEARSRSAEEHFGNEIALLRKHLEQQEKASEQAGKEFARLQTEISGLREQTAPSEAFRREIEQNWQQAAALRQDFERRLQDKDAELRAAQARADEIKSQIEAKLAELQRQLTERQLLAESRAAEIDNLKSELGELAEQSAARDSAAEELRSSLLNETASSRAAHQAELAALREEHSSRQGTLEVQLAQQSAQIAGLLGQIHELERRTTDSETEFQKRERRVAAATAESTALRARAQELESLRQAEKAAADSAVEQVRAKLEAELASSRHEVQQKAWALAQQQASMENLALTHRNQIQKLEERLTEQLHSVQDRNGEDERAQAQTRSLQRRIEELEMELQHAQLTAARGAEQVREEYTRRIEKLNAEVARHNAALQGREQAETQSEQTLRAEIDRLVRENQEKNLILQNRNDELVRVKSDRDALQESYKELTTVTTRNEAAVGEDAERMRTEFQAQLALLQAELSQKEWALEEQRAAASGLNLAHREQMETLHQRLAQTEARAKENLDKFVLGDETLTEEQQERRKKYREVIEVVTSGDGRSFPVSENRRWRTRFAWKRRWK